MNKLAIVLVFIGFFSTRAFAQEVVEKDGKFGLKDEGGTTLLKTEYDQLIPVNGGELYVLCKKNPNYNGVAGGAKIEVPKNGYQLESLGNSCFSAQAGDLKFSNHFIYGLLEYNQTIIPVNYDAIYFHGDTESYFVKTGGYWYAFDTGKRKIIKKSKASSICRIEEGFIVELDGKFGAMDHKFKYKQKVIYDKIEQVDEEGNIYILHKDQDKVLMASWNLELLPMRPVQEIYPDSIDGNALIKRGGKYGVMEIYEGGEMIETKYDGIEPFGIDDQLKVKEGAFYGLISSDDDYVKLPSTYEDVVVLDKENGIIKVKKEGKWQVMKDVDVYEPISDKTFESIKPLLGVKDIYQVRQDGKIGFVKKKGFEELMAPQFGTAKPIKSKSFDYLEVTKGGKKGLIDLIDFSVVFPAEYDEYKDISEGKSTVFQLKKNGKWGVKQIGNSLFDLPFEYDKLDFLADNKWVIAQKGNKTGLLWNGSTDKKVLDFEYEDIRVDAQQNGCLVYAKKNGNWGILEVSEADSKTTVKTLRGFTFEEIAPIEGEGLDGYVKVKEKGNFGLYQINNGVMGQTWREVLPAAFDDISYESKLTVRVKKQGKSGSATLSSGHVLYINSINDVFPLKWKAKVGQTTFRTNMIFAHGWVLVGSNGESRGSLKDSQDGLYMLDPRSGKTIRHLKPEVLGDTDVNGVATSGNYLFFGNDNNGVFCYDFDGKKVWQATVDGDIEGSPSLFDSNGDGIDDAVFATESGSVMAFDGKTGKELWRYKASNGGYFVATPAAYDVNADGTPDVLIGTGGSPYFYAINGKTGKELWQFKTKSTAGFVDGSGIHASASILTGSGRAPLIVATECYGILHYLDMNGQWKRYIGNTIGIFSSPVFSPKGTVVNGAAWMGRGNVDVTVIRSAADWEEQRGGVKYAARRTQMDGSPVAVTSSSAFVADVLAKGKPQIGIADETGKFQLLNEDGIVEEIMLAPAGVEAAMLVQDVDGDGRLEIIVACLDGNVYCYDTESKAKPFWGQFRGDNKNTGLIRMP